MRPFKELYDNKNHADLQELEKSYDRFRDTVRTLFKKVDQAADEAETRYLMETVREIGLSAIYQRRNWKMSGQKLHLKQLREK